MTATTCRCGQGKASAYDGKCGHCRTQRERKRHAELVAAADLQHYGIGLGRALCGQPTTAATETTDKNKVTCKPCAKGLGVRLRPKPLKGGVL